MKECGEWVTLSGCNACINSALCGALGNCALLSVNETHPDNNKKKRRYIQRIRTMSPFDTWRYLGDLQKQQTEFPVSLTKLEKLFVEELNKPR